ncbi:MAG: uracil-DNA glycosylase [Chitinophagaceae bacterium]|nr:uracil-DNA glycosylase [Chitinophagaceae bacterium]
MDVKIESSWKQALRKEFGQAYFHHIVAHLKTEREQGKTIYPRGADIFRAFNTTPLDKVKLVIIGQDPYHGPGQAHGLCFSVQKGTPAPPSLVNIFKELQEDTGISIPSHGDLSYWAEQGVFLLNASLSVRAGEPMSHSKIGWAQFTDNVIKTLSDQKRPLVFFLWGKFAQEKILLIDQNKHLVLKAAHPSPLSAHAGFFGCRHFSKANQWLMSKGIDPIDWKLP